MTSPAEANTVWLLLGSNIDPERNLPAAVGELQQFGRVTGTSRVWESPPFGYADQPNFLNAAVRFATPLSVDDLRRTVIPQIERRLRRVRDPANANGPRTIDVDVVLFNHAVLGDGPQRIPDPELLLRSFIAVPLAELDPHYVHPESGRTLSEIAAGFAVEAGTMLPRDDVVLEW